LESSIQWPSSEKMVYWLVFWVIFAEGVRAGVKAAVITCVATAVPTVCYDLINSLLFQFFFHDNVSLGADDCLISDAVCACWCILWLGSVSLEASIAAFELYF
jgi:hypothetical protein